MEPTNLVQKLKQVATVLELYINTMTFKFVNYKTLTKLKF